MPQMGVSVSEGTVTKWLKQVGEPIGQRRAAARDLDGQGRHRGAEPGRGRRRADPRPGGRDRRGRHGARAHRAGRSRGRRARRSLRRRLRQPEPPAPAEPAAAAPHRRLRRAGARAGQRSSRRPRRRSLRRLGQREDFVSPVVARIAAEHGVDPSAVPGTGTGGRVTKKDILAFIESGAAARRRPRRPAPDSRARRRCRRPQPRRGRARAGARAGRRPSQRPSPLAPVAPAPAPPALRRRRLLLRAARRRGRGRGRARAGRGARADDRDAARHRRAHAPLARHLCARHERDRGRHVARRRAAEEAQARVRASHGVNVTYLAFIARAVVETLKDYPWINGELRGEQIVTRSYVNLGFAVELADGKGLIVPVSARTPRR